MRSLVSILRQHASDRPNTVWAQCEERRLTFSETLGEAARWASLYQSKGLGPGDRLMIALPNGTAAITAFLGAHLLGCVPSLVPPQMLLSQQEFADRLSARAQLICAKIVVVSARTFFKGKAREFSFVDPQSLPDHGVDPGYEPSPSEVGLLQFTSGTSGKAKGIVLPHSALTHQAQVLCNHLEVDPEVDHALSWLPLYHDMGLFGFVLAPLLSGTRLTLLPTEKFMRRPLSWLEAISSKRATITAAPPSAYSLAARSVARRKECSIDLSSVRVALIGAEMIAPARLEEISAHLGAIGLRQTALLPAYGLAEVGVVATLTPLAAPPRGVAVDQQLLSSASAAFRCVDCGSAVQGSEVAIFQGDRRVGDDQIGSIALRSPYRARQYVTENGNLDIPSVLSDWMLTGDYGFVRDQNLFVLGREDDLIVAGGGRLNPEEIEEVAYSVAGEQVSLAVAVMHQVETGASEVVLLLHTPLQDQGERDGLTLRIRQQLAQRALPVHRVKYLPNRKHLRTANGKQSRAAYRELIAAGAD